MHYLLELSVVFFGNNVKYLINTGPTHNFVCKNFLASLSLQYCSGKSLEVVLANGRYVKTSYDCDIPIYFGSGLYYIVSYHVFAKLSSKLVLGMESLTSINPIIQWSNYEASLAFINSVVMSHR